MRRGIVIEKREEKYGGLVEGNDKLMMQGLFC